MENQSKTELRYGGLLLSIGALITIVCILLEVNAGWASLFVKMERTDYEAAKFLYENWGVMNPIWTWSLIGNVFLAIASMLLIKNSTKIGWFPSSLFWAIYFLGSLLLVISFAISLGSYYSAIKVIDDQPFIFEAIRGTSLYLFNMGALFGLSVFVIFFQQGFTKQGIVSGIYALFTLILIIASFIMVFLGVVSFAVFAISCFIVPLLLGIIYFKESLIKRNKISDVRIPLSTLHLFQNNSLQRVSFY